MSMVCEWMERARRDLRAARLLLREGLYNEAAFHAQQAAEKALKALLVANGVRPPKTHSIERLLSLLEQHIDANAFYEIEVDVLTDYAVETRYPGPFLDHDEATYAVEVAERAVELASRLLSERNIRCKE